MTDTARRDAADPDRTAATGPTGAAGDDPRLWLEDVEGDDALAWVRERNAESTAELAGPRFDALRDELREVLDSDARIPHVRRRGEHLYNFWQDATHRRGLWRRTTPESYRTDEPEWDVLLDVDALAEAEGENWVWAGAAVLRPEHRHALVELSRGGADATVVREFDLVTRQFVDPADGGYTLPEAKSRVGWIDVDTVFVGTDFGEGSLTSSGYPRILKEWRRGTPVDDAVTVFEGEHGDVAVWGGHDDTEGFERDVVGRNPDFFTSETWIRGKSGDELTHIDVPLDAQVDVHREWLLVRPRTDWAAGGRTYRAGTLLAAPLDDVLAGARDFEVLFEPDERTSLQAWSWTRRHLLLTTLADVKSRIEVLTPPERPGDDAWAREPLPGIPDVGSVTVTDTDPHSSDEYHLLLEGFTQPSTLRIGQVGGDAEDVKRDPAHFDAAGIEVEQLFATSADGTRVPYFVVGRRGNGPAPTYLTAYGGFEVSRVPAYSGIVGRGWLARGGVYVLANIRGGGEYGPAWHHAAMREKRPRAYEDLAAVASDLVARGITTRDRLGVVGGSNGGLLTGVMLTRYPELFGAVVIQVPLLDMKRYHLLLAGASWMAEYGDPDDPGDWAYLSTFSPYHNADPKRAYPPTLVMTSTRDDRVHPGHARKMAALLREQDRDVRYFENIEGGHGGAANNEQHAIKWALVFEFLWRTLGDR